MHSAPPHTNYFFRKLSLLVVFILTSICSISQDSTIIDTTVVDSYEDVIDTSYTNEENEKPVFDSLDVRDTTSYISHFIPDTTIERLKRDDAFWYANEVPMKKKPPTEKKFKPFYLAAWFKTFVWVLIIAAFISVIIWFLIASDVKLFRRKSTLILSSSDDNIQEDIFSIDYETELENAMQNKDFRLAVRLMYLHVLSLMAEREIIDYKIEKTNSVYLLQLYGTRYYKEFFLLTRHFEYIWYGKFDVSETGFGIIKAEYTSLKNRFNQ